MGDTSNNISRGPNLSLASIAPGQIVFDRYQIIRVLGSGISAAVYLSKDLGIGDRQVAIKIYHPGFSLEEREISRISREIRAAHSINHDNVVRFYDCLRDGSAVAITMEYVDGVTLRDFIAAHDDFEINDLIFFLYHICSGLHAIHNVGIIHRDIKPGNILVSFDGLLKITDFGLARRVESREAGIETRIMDYTQSFGGPIDKSLTGQGNVVGTPYYLSPEYLAHGQLDERSDVYAVGLIFYELLTKRRIFEVDTILDLVQLKLEIIIEPPDRINPACPPNLSRIIMKALARDPNQRYHNVESLLRDCQPLFKMLRMSECIRDFESKYKAGSSEKFSPGFWKKFLGSVGQKLTDSCSFLIDQFSQIAISLFYVLLVNRFIVLIAISAMLVVVLLFLLNPPAGNISTPESLSENAAENQLPASDKPADNANGEKWQLFKKTPPRFIGPDRSRAKIIRSVGDIKKPKPSGH
jgi:serine/threonine protein kinase